MSATATIDLTGLRAAAAAALEPPPEGWNIHPNLVESVEPPAIVLDWDEPWILPGLQGISAMGPCVYEARMRMLCIAGRTSPAEGIETLEGLVAYVLEQMKADPYPWRLDRVVSPGQFDIAGVTLYGAAVIYAIPTSI